jgi:hypothetical protein
VNGELNKAKVVLLLPRTDAKCGTHGELADRPERVECSLLTR